MSLHYKSKSRLAALYDLLSVYIPNYLADTDITPKRDILIRKVYDAPCEHDDKKCLYDLQLLAASTIFDIGTSQLLGENEIVVKYFVEEYAELKRLLTLINNNYKRLHQFPELKTCVIPWNVKEISSLLYDDLTQLCEEYNIECDVKQIVREM